GRTGTPIRGRATTCTPIRWSRSIPTRASWRGTISSPRMTRSTTTRRRCRCSPTWSGAAATARSCCGRIGTASGTCSIARTETSCRTNQYVGRFTTMPVPPLRTGPGAVNQRLPEEAWGAIQAFDPKSGELKWQFKMSDVTDSGVLATASDLVFAGGREGYFFALDARTGELLWKSSVGGQVSAAPITYGVAGRQYV